MVADALSQIPNFSGLELQIPAAEKETEVLTVTTHAQAKRAAELANTSDSGLGADVPLESSTKNNNSDRGKH